LALFTDFIIIFVRGLGRLTCSGIDALPSFPGASAIRCSPGFVGEGVFQQSSVVRSFELVDPVLFVFDSHVLYSLDTGGLLLTSEAICRTDFNCYGLQAMFCNERDKRHAVIWSTVVKKT